MLAERSVYNGKEGCLCVHVCVLRLCTFAVVGPPPWRMTIKPSVALSCSHYPSPDECSGTISLTADMSKYRVNMLIRAQNMTPQRQRGQGSVAHYFCLY